MPLEILGMGIGGGIVVAAALGSRGELELVLLMLVVEGSGAIGREAREQRCGKSHLESCHHHDSGAI